MTKDMLIRLSAGDWPPSWKCNEQFCQVELNPRPSTWHQISRLIHLGWLVITCPFGQYHICSYTHTCLNSCALLTKQYQNLVLSVYFFALCSWLVVPNVEITYKFPSSACITVSTCLQCNDGLEGEWISECFINWDSVYDNRLKSWWLFRYCPCAVCM